MLSQVEKKRGKREAKKRKKKKQKNNPLKLHVRWKLESYRWKVTKNRKTDFGGPNSVVSPQPNFVERAVFCHVPHRHTPLHVDTVCNALIQVLVLA
jgi:hypothetical protein